MGVTVRKTKRFTRRSKRLTAGLTAFLLSVGLAASVAGQTTAQAAPVNQGPVGNGFTVTPGDLEFILKQIKIAERHSRSLQGTQPGQPANPDPLGDPEYCQALIGQAADQIPDPLTSYGLRTVDGGCNNLVKGTLDSVNRNKFAAADVPFPRLTNPNFRDAQVVPAGFGTTTQPVGASTSYKQKKGNVFDSEPRTISNLIVDQTDTNPAAIDAAAHPVRTQDPTPTAIPCPGAATDPIPCTPTNHTLFIPNVTTDVGLSPPYNSLFTFFGQFFDHGVDQTVKSGGTVFVPLNADDPLRTVGPDGIPGNGDEVPANQAFMVLTRAQNQPGPDGILGDDPSTPAVDESADDIQNANNTDTPWVDQSQTYTSHPSHQVFVREYALNSLGRPVSTGKLLGGLPVNAVYPGSPDSQDGIGNWAAVKLQAATKLGLKLVDRDVTNIPMIATDPYGKFIPGALRGLPQYVTATGLVEGNIASPVLVPANVLHFDTPFLTDIAHNADPSPQDVDNNPATPAVAPTPDLDSAPSADFLHQPAGTYDDELLNSHFVCGDGRCNENIALSTIHQVFHSEHDRLVDYIKGVLTSDTSATGVRALPEWQLPTTANPSGWNGERLFQAARFVTEMEYQHLVFEEFARKVQPAVRPFHVYTPDVNPAIEAEFAHAVYRFGHSMLDDDVARKNADGSDNSIPLLTAFLNPPEFFNGGTAGTLTPEAAAGSIIMGSSDQTGNELDEFVVQTLRNNLLGLPLDLPTLNMTRARDAGIPPLNDVRRQIFAQTNDAQLAPYTSWTDFGEHLKHPASLVNFIAAYGTDPSIVSDPTIAGKRAAANAIIAAAAAGPGAAADFLASTGAYANVGGKTVTGVDGIDLWVGGLAEVTNVFGGLLGSTFNYVFQSQLEKLQEGDRLYYLARTPGMNLRSQLEGNSFSEIIQRNTSNTNTLKADAFATADCKFQLSHLNGTPAGFVASGASVADDLTTPDCNENLLLLRKPDGTIQYKAINTVDPSGINGQAVYQGTAGDDRVFGGNDNDTFWGGTGNDVIEGGGGDDVALGGDGNDIITDLSGADILKGGPGNDAIDAGIGDDIVIGGDGQDFMNGGANDNESFAGPGNDYIIAGQGADTVFGDGGDDWIEGGTGQDLLQGDHGAPFFDDPAEPQPGNDIFVGQPGENDYDAEGGDDIMEQNPAIDRNAGAAGFDWAAHQYDTVGGDDDLEINQQLVGLPIQLVVNRDRWQETEADSGSPFNDIIRGDDLERVVGPGGFQGCDALDPAGVARIGNLNKLVTEFPSALQPVIDASAAKYCPLVGFGANPAVPGSGSVWAEGNVLLGGAGSDIIEGRGNNDIIDGDHALTVRISVRANADGTGAEIASTDLMEHKAITGSFGLGSTTEMTLQQAVFAGIVNAGQLVNVREILMAPDTATAIQPNNALTGDCGLTGAPTATSTNCDVAQYSTTADQYTINRNTNGSVTVAFHAPAAEPPGALFAKGDGIDTLWNIEDLQFCNANDPVTKKCTGFDNVPVSGLTPTTPVTANVSPASLSFGPVFVGTTSATQSVTVANTGTGTLNVNGALVTGPDADQFTATNNCTTITGPGTCTVDLVFNPTTTAPLPAKSAELDINTNANGLTQVVPLTGTAQPLSAPSAPAITSVTTGSGTATVAFTAPTSTGGSPLTGFVAQALSGATVVSTQNLGSAATSATFIGLTNGVPLTFRVSAINAIGTGPASSPVVGTPSGPAPAPTGVSAIRGNASAIVSWTPPASNGGTPITGYQIVIGGGGSGLVTGIPAGATSATVPGLANGTSYTFQVQAINAAGPGTLSAASNAVTPATVPGLVTAVSAVKGNASATVSWLPPASNGGSPITGFSIQVLNATTNVQIGVLRPAPAGATSLLVTGLVNGTAVKFVVTAANALGSGAPSAASAAVTPAAAATAPGAPTIGTASALNATSVTVRWTAPASNGGSAITGYSVKVVNAANVQVGLLRPAAAGTTSLVVTGLTTAAVRFQVSAINAVGTGPASVLSNTITLIVPGAPVVGTGVIGAVGAPVTFTARWTAGAANAGPAVTAYRVTVRRFIGPLGVGGNGVQTTAAVPAGAVVPTSLAITAGLTSGFTYRYTVQAVNVVGNSVASAASASVTAR
jgi:Ca2+-binding RTX toxin-like protein